MDTQFIAGFPPVTREQWEQQILTDLRGKPYESLVWTSEEGIAVSPVYTAPASTPISHLPAGRQQGSWEIVERITVKNAAEANKRALQALNSGATALHFVITSNDIYQQLEILLAGIELPYIQVGFTLPAPAGSFVTQLQALLAKQQVDAGAVNGWLSLDILGKMARNGKKISPEQRADFEHFIATTTSAFPGLRNLYVDAAAFHNAGASLVQELAFGLAQAHEYLAWLLPKSNGAKPLAQQFQVQLAVGTNYFFEIAKFRAFRQLWALVLQKYTADVPLYLSAETATLPLTAYDTYVNLLRNTTQGMAAISGGADALTILPFDLPVAEENAFSARMARNIQLILAHESYLDKVNDPAAGAYYIEELTSQLKQKAWELFVEIEQKGGYTVALETGFIQEQLRQSAAKKYRAVDERKLVLLGTNQYPNLKEKITPPVPTVPAEGEDFEPVQPFRLSESLEQIRETTERSPERTGILLQFGDRNMRSARAAFSRNFLACGGFVTLEPAAQDTFEAAVAAVTDPGFSFVVLCAADEDYALAAAGFAAAFPGKAILMAGNPGDKKDLYTGKGVHHFIHLKSPLSVSLRALQQQLGI